MKKSFNFFNERANNVHTIKPKLDKRGNRIENEYEPVPPTVLFLKRWSLKTLGFLLAASRGLIAVGAYAAIAVFAAPVALGFIAASGSAGSTLVAGLGAAAAWVGSLPVVSAVGSTVAAAFATLGTYLGLSAGTAAAATAAFTLVAAPVLAATKVVVRWCSGNKPCVHSLSDPVKGANTQEIYEGTRDGSKHEQSREFRAFNRDKEDYDLESHTGPGPRYSVTANHDGRSSPSTSGTFSGSSRKSQGSNQTLDGSSQTLDENDIPNLTTTSFSRRG